MLRAQLIALLAIAHIFAAASFAEAPVVLGSHEIILTYRSANTAPVDGVKVWVRTDDSAWSEARVSRYGPFAVKCRVPHDGNYSFYITLENERGRSGSPPNEQSRPHTRATVDTHPPTLQIHRVTHTQSSDNRLLLRLTVSLVDENLGEAGTHLYYRVNSENGWEDAGVVVCRNGIVTCRPPIETTGRVDLRLAATDRAGNRAVDEIQNVRIPRQSFEPAEADTAQTRILTPVKPLEPVTVAPVRLASLVEESTSEASGSTTLRHYEQARRLHEQGAEYLKQGRTSLALARFQKALEYMPEQPDMLSDLGAAYFREKQYDLAGVQFTQALEADPNHVGAIEGQALVAMVQKRYPEARSHMRHLLKLNPDNAENWLHFGDVEHVLGARAAARAAWKQAMQIDAADEFVREEANKRLSVFSEN